MKKISVRKTETVRLTSAAQPLYAGDCGGSTPVLK
ncbi:Bacteriocin-like protein [Stackebrandtia soli]